MTENNSPSSHGRGFDLSEPVSSFVETAKGVLSERRGFFSGIATTGSLKAPLVFAVICLLLSWFLGGIAGYLLEGDLTVADDSGFGLLQGGQLLTGVAITAVFVVLSPLLALLRLYVYAGVVHLLVMGIMPRRLPFEATLRVYCYATAVALLSWVPFVGWIASVYGLYLLVVGLREVHGRASEAATAGD